MTTTLQNSIWPNDDGNLGKIKVQIPDGVNVQWPEGDALLGNCVYQNGKLVGFVDTKALTVNSSGNTTINYDYVNIELPFAEDAMTINRGPRSKYLFIKFNDKEVEEGIVYVRFEELSDETKALLRSATTIRDNVLYDENDNVIGEFNTDALLTCHNVVIDEDGNPVKDESTGKVKTIDGKLVDTLYYETTDSETGQKRNLVISEFSSSLSKLFSGYGMFTNSSMLRSFTSDLSKLKYGYMMFTNCKKLINFSSNLPALINGTQMFISCISLESFTSDLSSLTTGVGMFSACSNLTTFSSNLDNLNEGNGMFAQCPKLTSFKSNLSKLTNGYGMFVKCKLDTASVQNIAETISTVTNRPQITIGIGNSTPNTEETTAFNNMVSKGWTVYVNGTSSSNKWDPTSIAPENGEEVTTPFPYYAKPVPATEEIASYVDANGNYYNIVGAQFIYGDDLSTYGMFTCEDDAAANMRLTKIEK
jgi:hypothetical protein